MPTRGRTAQTRLMIHTSDVSPRAPFLRPAILTAPFADVENQTKLAMKGAVDGTKTTEDIFDSELMIESSP